MARSECSYSIRRDVSDRIDSFLVGGVVCCSSRSFGYTNRKILITGLDEGCDVLCLLILDILWLSLRQTR